MTIRIDVTKHFDDFHGLKRTDSLYSAEALREDVLRPTFRDLRPNERLVIMIDSKDKDPIEYSAAYLKEAFVGLITYNRIRYADFIHYVAFDCEHKESQFYIQKIFQYAKEMHGD